MSGSVEERLEAPVTVDRGAMWTAGAVTDYVEAYVSKALADRPTHNETDFLATELGKSERRLRERMDALERLAVAWIRYDMMLRGGMGRAESGELRLALTAVEAARGERGSEGVEPEPRGATEAHPSPAPSAAVRWPDDANRTLPAGAPSAVPLAEQRAYMAHPEAPPAVVVCPKCGSGPHTYVGGVCGKCGYSAFGAPSPEPLADVLARVDRLLRKWKWGAIALSHADAERLVAVAKAAEPVVTVGPSDFAERLAILRHAVRGTP